MIKLFVKNGIAKIEIEEPKILESKDFQVLLDSLEDGTILSKLYNLVPNRSILEQAKQPIIESYTEHDSKKSLL